MRFIIPSLAALFLAGCSGSQHSQPSRETTAACMEYQSMMTAPMPPEAMRRLQKACAASTRDRGE
ncbi:MAG: hypothetical protein ABF759_14505 [Acetobacter malorum]|uniref:hypothetical protein n=1 Tax=Acetobacter malorum TaxID=178901 RepID=UPI0039E7ACAB